MVAQAVAQAHLTAGMEEQPDPGQGEEAVVLQGLREGASLVMVLQVVVEAERMEERVGQETIGGMLHQAALPGDIWLHQAMVIPPQT